ncbi:hypothetical protein SVAN01_07241 [Stagonosporopsis vannaccii]|nr:hypothetical protein SVAN01_07241 [Stagonosporopsis vannaccii]
MATINRGLGAPFGAPDRQSLPLHADRERLDPRSKGAARLKHGNLEFSIRIPIIKCHPCCHIAIEVPAYFTEDHTDSSLGQFARSPFEPMVSPVHRASESQFRHRCRV